MTRSIFSVCVLGLLVASLGCHHIAGICDCDPRTYGCRTGPQAVMPVLGSHEVQVDPTEEPIKEMPKKMPKELPIE